MASIDIDRWNKLCKQHHTTLADITVDAAIDKRKLRNTKTGWVIWDNKNGISTVASKSIMGKHRNDNVAVLSKGNHNAYTQTRRAADANSLILTGKILPGYVVGTYVGFNSRFHTYFSMEDFDNLTQSKTV